MTIDEVSQEVLAVRFRPLTGRYDQLVTDDFRVHRSVFTDPKIFDDEMERVFGGTWVYLLHDTEVAAPDEFRALRVGRHPVLVTRHDDGGISALLNRCTHPRDPPLPS